MGTNVLGDAVLAAIDAYIGGLSSPQDLNRQALMRVHHNEIEDWIVAAHSHWLKVADPATGWLASKTSPWTADRFCSPGEGDTPVFQVDFSSVVPADTRIARAACYKAGIVGYAVWCRKAGDTNISNTPNASAEHSHLITYENHLDIHGHYILWLSADYKVQFAVQHASVDFYVAYPESYVL